MNCLELPSIDPICFKVIAGYRQEEKENDTTALVFRNSVLSIAYCKKKKREGENPF